MRSIALLCDDSIQLQEQEVKYKIIVYENTVYESRVYESTVYEREKYMTSIQVQEIKYQ